MATKTKHRAKTVTTQKSVRTSVSLPPELHDTLARMAKGKKVSVAWIIREAVEKYLRAESPLFRPEYASAWSQYDPKLANALLDELGLTDRGGGGIRILPDGRQAGIVVETAGESSLETDVLELVRDRN